MSSNRVDVKVKLALLSIPSGLTIQPYTVKPEQATLLQVSEKWLNLVDVMLRRCIAHFDWLDAIIYPSIFDTASRIRLLRSRWNEKSILFRQPAEGEIYYQISPSIMNSLRGESEHSARSLIGALYTPEQLARSFSESVDAACVSAIRDSCVSGGVIVRRSCRLALFTRSPFIELLDDPGGESPCVNADDIVTNSFVAHVEFDC